MDERSALDTHASKSDCTYESPAFKPPKKGVTGVTSTQLLPGYEISKDIYDEAFEPSGQPRPHYAELLERLTNAPLASLHQRLIQRLRERAVTFGEGPEGLFALDLVPRILTPAEWDRVAAGILQRASALERFAADVYGERKIVAAGHVPERVIEGSVHLEPAMRHAAPAGSWVTAVGFDLVRSPDGEFRVLEDQIRMPSGLAYAVAARELLDELLPPANPLAEIGGCFDRLGEALRAAAPDGSADPTIVLLSEGETAAGWYEHARLARELSIPIVGLEALERRNGEIVARVEGKAMGVDVIYQRTDEDRFTDSAGNPTALGELLLEPCREGRVSCVNTPGSGVGDDKLVHAYVETMIRFYLGEDPLLPSVTTYDLGEPDARERAMASLDDLVVKPRGKMGGEGVVVWSQASEQERQAALNGLDEAPEQFVAQERVELSHHPTVCDGALEPRRVDLRPYVIRAGESQWALPGGLTRVALERGSLIVNSGQGGGAKDTWVLEG